MSDTLAKMKVILEASTSAYKKEMKQAKQVTKSVSDSVQAETAKVKQSMKMDNVTESVKKQTSAIQKLKGTISSSMSDEMKNLSAGLKDTFQDTKSGALFKFAATEIRNYTREAQVAAGIRAPTKQYTELDNAIQKTEKELEQLYEKQNKTTKSKTVVSDEWKKIHSDIQKTENSLESYYGKERKMRALGLNSDKNKAWKSLQYDIQSARQKLEALREIEQGMDGPHIVETEEWKRVTSEIQEARATLHQYYDEKNSMQSTGNNAELARTGKLSDGNHFESAAAVAKRALGDVTGRIKEMKGATAEALKRIPVLGRALSDAAYLGTKGWGGLKKIISGVGSGIKTLASGAIRKASGVFGALIKKVANGIPILRRFTGASKTVSGELGSGLKNILKYTLGIRSLFALVNKLRSALVDGFKNLSQYSGETNNSISMLMSSLTQLKNAFAAAFAPVLNMIVPILNAVIQKIISVVNAFGELTSALTGKAIFIKAKKVQQDYAKSLNSNANSAENAKKANEELQRTILRFDQINKMDDNSSSDSNSGIADTDGLSASDMFETQNVSSKISNIADMIKQAWKNADFTDIGTMVGNKLNSALNSIPWDKIRNTCNRIATSIATFLNGFIEATDWTLVGNTISKGINTAFSTVNTFVQNFHWKSLGDAIGNGINGALGGLDWGLIQETVRNTTTGLMDMVNSVIQTTDWTLVGQSFGNAINTLLDFIYTAIHNFDWKGAGVALADFVAGTIQTLDTGKIGGTISDAITGLLDFALGFVEGTDWGEMADTLYNKIKDFITNIDFAGIADRTFELIGAAFGGLASFVGTMISNAINDAKKYFQKKTEESGGSVVKGIFKGIKDAIEGIYTWIKDHVFKPIMNGFREAFGIHSPSTVMAEQGKYIIEGLLKGVKDNISSFIDDIKKIPKKTLNAIGNIKDKVLGKGSDIVSGLKEGLSDKWSDLTEFLTDIPQKIRDAVPDLFSVGSDIIQSFRDGFSSIHIPLPHINWSTVEHHIGGLKFRTPSFSLQWYAKGGFPEAGQLFVANEAGPEMVGKMGNRNIVANNNQIIEGIKNGVFEAVLDAFSASGLLDRDDSEKEVVLEFTLKADSETLYKAVRKGKKKYNYRYAIVETV